MGWQKQVYLSSTQFGKEMVIIPPCSAVACLWQMDGNFIWLQWTSTPKYSLFYRLRRLMLAFMQRRWQTRGNTGEKEKGRRHDTVHHKESGGKPFSLWHAVTKLFLLEEGEGEYQIHLLHLCLPPSTPPPGLTTTTVSITIIIHILVKVTHECSSEVPGLGEEAQIISSEPPRIFFPPCQNTPTFYA